MRGPHQFDDEGMKYAALEADASTLDDVVAHVWDISVEDDEVLVWCTRSDLCLEKLVLR